jgi:hypothetical protein
VLFVFRNFVVFENQKNKKVDDLTCPWFVCGCENFIIYECQSIKNINLKPNGIVTKKKNECQTRAHAIGSCADTQENTNFTFHSIVFFFHCKKNEMSCNIIEKLCNKKR